MSFKKNAAIIFALVATELIGFGLIIPILPQVSHQFTNSGILLGLLLSSYSLAQFIAAPILGQLSDKFGRKPLLIISKVGTISSYIILAMATNYTWILLSRLLDGFTGGNIAVARAYLADITPEEHRSKAMAIIGVAFGTGFIFGPAIGSFCYAATNNFELAGWIGAGLSAASLLITVIFLNEPNHMVSQPSPRQSTFQQLRTLSNHHWQLFATAFFSMMIFSGFETSFSIFTESKFGFQASQNSTMFFVIGIVAFFIQGSFTRFSIKPISKALTVALLCMGLGLILPNLSHHVAISLFPLVFLIFGVAILNTHIPAELSLSSTKKGFMMGTYESINGLARILGPLVIFSVFYHRIDSLFWYLGFGAILYLLVYHGIRFVTTK